VTDLRRIDMAVAYEDGRTTCHHHHDRLRHARLRRLARRGSTGGALARAGRPMVAARPSRRRTEAEASGPHQSRRTKRRMNRARGFTLLELLIAVAIFAVIGVMAYGGLQAVLAQQVIARDNADRFREIQFAVQQLSRDLYQVSPARCARNSAMAPAARSCPMPAIAIRSSSPAAAGAIPSPSRAPPCSGSLTSSTTIG
jgi:prepilin-type N-terminal cleavage/methylation domain-containing protein